VVAGDQRPRLVRGNKALVATQFQRYPTPSMRMAVSSQSHAMRRALDAEIGPIQVSGGAGGGFCGGCLIGSGVVLVVLTGGGEVFVADE